MHVVLIWVPGQTDPETGAVAIEGPFADRGGAVRYADHVNKAGDFIRAAVRPVNPTHEARYVSAPLGAGKAPESNTTSLIHACLIDAQANVTAVLCNRAKPQSILSDSSLFNVHAVDCRSCLAIMKREKIVLG